MPGAFAGNHERLPPAGEPRRIAGARCRPGPFSEQHLAADSLTRDSWKKGCWKCSIALTFNMTSATTILASPTTRPSAAHIVELDGLRGIAALMVIFYHAFFWSMGGNWHSVAKLIASVTQFGWTGVDLFFVLSG